jgi:hypothetical protein
MATADGTVPAAFHWHLEFPGVFRPPGKQAGSTGIPNRDNETKRST